MSNIIIEQLEPDATPEPINGSDRRKISLKVANFTTVSLYAYNGSNNSSYRDSPRTTEENTKAIPEKVDQELAALLDEDDDLLLLDYQDKKKGEHKPSTFKPQNLFTIKEKETNSSNSLGHYGRLARAAFMENATTQNTEDKADLEVLN